MGGAVTSRMIIVGAGLLYPAYCSYKTVKSQNIRQYVRWIMYWVVFALFSALETFTDVFLPWLPFYYEAKIIFVCWLVLPYSKGSTTLYKKFIHPNLSKREQEIDLFLENAKERSYQTVVNVGSKGINLAASAVVTAAVKSQAVVSDRLKSYSVMDLTSIPESTDIHRQQAPFAIPNPMLVRERRLQSSPPNQEVDGVHPQLSTQYKAYSMMNLTQTTEAPFNDDSDWDEEYFSTEPPSYTIDDMQITKRNNYAEEAVPNPADNPSQFFTMPRPKKGAKNKTKQMPPLPASEESRRRSKRKTKSKRDADIPTE